MTSKSFQNYANEDQDIWYSKIIEKIEKIEKNFINICMNVLWNEMLCYGTTWIKEIILECNSKSSVKKSHTKITLNLILQYRYPIIE